MENNINFLFTENDLANSPSRKCGISESRELSYRQQAANFIQDMGQRLGVNQLCINTAIVYMQRFYVYHSFSEIHRNKLSLSALFLAAKVEEQPRKIEHVIKVAHACLHNTSKDNLDVRSDAYNEKVFEVVAHENILLQTLGFVLGIEHPHTYVVKVSQLVKASKDLAQTSYIMATTSLHMTNMCLLYKPTVVACVCIHLACKWSDWRIEKCSEGRDWFYYVDKTVTHELLETLTDRFVEIMENSPHRFKRRFGQKDHGPRSLMEDCISSKGDANNIKREISSPGPSGLTYDFDSFDDKPLFREKTPPLSSQPSSEEVPPPSTSQLPVKSSTPVQPPSSQQTSWPVCKKQVKAETPHSTSISLDSYREKREKEKLLSKVPPSLPVDSPSGVHSQNIKQHTFPESEKIPHRTHAKHGEHHLSKDRLKREDQPMPVHSTSMNKANHQYPKVNSGHSKDRSSSHSHSINTFHPVTVNKTEKKRSANRH